jgi:formate hydrogenlyase subunit 4
MTGGGWVALGLTLVAAPALPSIVHRTRSLLTGRRGAPIVQPYRDLARLWRKGTVYSRTTTWVFRVAPLLLLATTAAAASLLPLDGRSAPLTFTGDFDAFWPPSRRPVRPPRLDRVH